MRGERGGRSLLGSGTSIAARLFVVQAVSILLAAGVAVVFLAVDARGRAEGEATQRSLVVAESIARNPFVVAQFSIEDPSSTLQPYAAELMTETDVDFITIMRPDRTRYTHRDPAEIGGLFVGTIAPALAGRTFSETYAGTLGPSLRTVAPVEDESGAVVGLVSAGITLSSVDRSFAPRLNLVLAAAAGLVALGGLVSWLLSRYLRRVTGGRGPEQMSQVFAYYESVLHSVHEGLVLVDGRGRLVLANDHAVALLGLDGVRTPVDVASLPLAPAVREVLAGGSGVAGGSGGSGGSGRSDDAHGSDEVIDEIVVTADRILVLSRRPAVSPGAGRTSAAASAGHGTVTIIRDRTEIQRVSGELESMRTMSVALRSQTHEFSNRLHTIASLLELDRPREALDFAAEELNLSQRLADRVLSSIEEPVIAALMLGKSAQARERGVALHLETHLEPGTQGLDPATLVSILGNLVDNAIDAAAGGAAGGPAAGGAAAGGEPWVEVYLGLSDGDRGDLVIQVSDSGPGLDPEIFERAFDRGYSTKPGGADGRGFGLAIVRQLVTRLGGTIEVDRHVGAVFTVQVPLAAGTPVVR